MIPKPTHVSEDIFRKFPKITEVAEDFPGTSEDVSINTNKFKYGERVKHALISNITSLISLQLNYRKFTHVFNFGFSQGWKSL